jgi:hypothetical protein
MRAALIALLATAASSAPAQIADQCQVYAAAITYLEPDSSARLVVYDSTSLGVPQFAFHAWTSMGRKADTGFVVTDSMFQAMREENRNRRALPECISSSRRTTRLRYDSLRASFGDKQKGWDNFKAAYPGADGFYMFSKVFSLTSDGSQALLYAAHARDWLNGGGRVLFLRKRDGVWRVEAYRYVWLS